MPVLSLDIGGSERATGAAGRPEVLSRGAHGPFTTFWPMLTGGGIAALPLGGGTVFPLVELEVAEGGKGGGGKGGRSFGIGIQAGGGCGVCISGERRGGTGALPWDSGGVLTVGEEDRKLLRCRILSWRSRVMLARIRRSRSKLARARSRILVCVSGSI